MPRKKILVVDDAATVRVFEGMILKGSCYDVVTACDGLEAVEKAQREQPDLIVLDVMMPNLDGLEACRRIRQEPRTAGIPIIIVTSRGDPEMVEACYAGGCNELATKPVDAAELLAKVRCLLGER